MLVWLSSGLWLRVSLTQALPLAGWQPRGMAGEAGAAMSPGLATNTQPHGRRRENPRAKQSGLREHLYFSLTHFPWGRFQIQFILVSKGFVKPLASLTPWLWVSCLF